MGERGADDPTERGSGDGSTAGGPPASGGAVDGPAGSDPDTGDLPRTVSRRAPLLRALEAGPRTKGDLTAALSVSRPTVDRALRELEAVEAVARTEEGYRLRLPGRLLLQVHERYRRRIEGTQRATALLAALPAEFDLDPAVVEGAEVVTAGGPSLHRPIVRQRAMIEGADHVRGFWAAVPQYAETYHRQAADHDMTIELVVQPTVTQRLLAQCGGVIERGLSTGQFAMRERDAGPPCNLVVCEHDDGATLGFTVQDADGVVGFLESECPEAVAWGEAFFERHWEAGEPLVPSETRER